LADACRLSFEIESFNHIFAELAGHIAHDDIPACTDYRPLDYDEFLAVFDAQQPPGTPPAATAADLFADAAPDRPLGVSVESLISASQLAQVIDPLHRQVQETMEAIGLHVTALDDNHEDGIIVTAGPTEILFGQPTELNAKAAFLAALFRTGQVFSHVDVRHVDAPSYH
jgi:chlorophyllide a reductase subunit X